MSAVEAFIALGGNLGDVLGTFRRALAKLRAGGVDVIEVSSAYRTAPLVPPGGDERVPDYWNAVCRVRTELGPHALLSLLHAVEAELGRVRRERWASRTLDLDLLVHGELQSRGDRLAVPHPELAHRLFVLRPLAELAPDLRIPGGASVSELLARHPDPEAGILERLEEWGAREA